MAVNVLSSLGFEHSRELLERSFAQFQADKSVAKLIIERSKYDEGIQGFFEAMQCDQGDFLEYMELRRKITDIEKGKSIKPITYVRGDVIELSRGRHSLPAIITQIKQDARGKRSYLTLDAKGKTGILQGNPPVIGRIRLKESFNPKKKQTNLLEQLWHFSSPTGSSNHDLDALRISLRSHPCHHCNDRDQHARWGERWLTAKKEQERLELSIARRTNVLRKDFERIVKILLELGYLQQVGNSYELKPSAEMLRRIHTESELLLSQVLQTVDFEGVDSHIFAALMSTLVFESRSDRDQRGPRLHHPEFRSLLLEFQHIQQHLIEVEDRFGYRSGQNIDGGFAWSVHQWSKGVRLTELLSKSEISAGDFVRSMRRLLDLLEQIAHLGIPNVSALAKSSIDTLKRGILVVSDFEE
jgi:ATP-dependent RNA helicase HelY